MARYIDADTLKRHYCWWTDEYKEIFDDIIDVQPTADVRENVRGEWKNTITYHPYCSACEWFPEDDEMTHGFYNFCPNCGADMRGEQ